METKMKDNDIIKALELCIQVDSNICDICPLYDEENGCLEIDLRKPALDLINRQKAEIEELNKYKHDYYVLKAETAKDFAGKFVKKIKDVNFTIGQTWEIECALKRTLQEMTEGNGNA